MPPGSSKHWLTLLLGLLSLVQLASAATPTVTVSKGKIQGIACKDGGANSLVSIPYAQPPLVLSAWHPPHAFNGRFNGALVATTPVPSCRSSNLTLSSVRIKFSLFKLNSSTSQFERAQRGLRTPVRANSSLVELPGNFKFKNVSGSSHELQADYVPSDIMRVS